MRHFDNIFLSEKNEFLYSFYRLIYCLLMSWGLSQYARGYNLFFEFYVLPSGKNILIQNLNQLQILIGLTILSLIFAGLGIFRKYSLVLSLVLFSLLQLNISPLLKEYTTNISFFILLLFIVSPTTRWSWKLSCSPILGGSCFVLAVFYLSSALSKVIHNPFDWFTGDLLKEHIFYNFALTGKTQLLDILQRPMALKLLSWGILFFELSFIMTIFMKQMRICYLVLGLVFHFCIYYFFSINFFHFFVPVYLAGFFMYFPELNEPNLES